MYSTNYIIGFIVVLTAAVAVLLTGLREATKERAIQNEEIFNKRAILTAVNDYLPEGKPVSKLTDAEVLQTFNEQVEQITLDMSGTPVDGMLAEDIDMAKERKKPEGERHLPLFIYNQDGKEYYILAVRGNGLWDEIWGYISLQDDLNTIAGATFDHKGETPGLGAEIKDNPSFSAQFKGKQLYEAGQFVSVVVRKGGARDEQHEVDAISGATITSDGVTEMIRRGIQYYEPFLEQARQKSPKMSVN